MLPESAQRWGEINGLPTSRGRLLCTDGILCCTQNDLGDIFIGHVNWFVPDAKSRTREKEERTTRGEKEATKLLEALGYV